MALDLFIDGKRCDLVPGTLVPMSYRNNVIGEAIRPAGSASRQFKLPRTQQNVDIFEVAHSINSDTDKPYKKLPVRLVQNGRELISDGFAIIEESSQFYEVVVYGGNLDFFEDIRGKTLRDLDLSAHDHIWNFVNVANSRQKIDGYIYPIIDWNEDGAFMDNLTDKIDPRTMYHAMHVHTIMTAIFNESGFNKSGDVLDDQRYKDMVVPIVDSIQSDTLKADRLVERKIAGGGTPTAQISTGQQGSDDVIVNPVVMNGFIKDTYLFMTFRSNWFTSLGTLATYAYLAPVTGSYTVKFTGKHSQTENVFFSVSLQLWRVKPSGQRTIVASVGVTESQVSFDFDTTFNMDQGDFLTPVIVSGGTFPVNQFPKAFILDPFISIEANTPKNIYNTLISAGDNLPDMTQTDFVKSIAKIFGIIFQTDSFSKTVEFKGFKTTYGNIPKAINWTDKNDQNTTNKNPVIKYHPQGYAQRNVFKWTNDTSKTLPEELGEGEILIADESLTEEVVLIQIPFSATEMTKKLVDLDVPIIPFLKLGLPKGAQRPRILLMRREVNDKTVTYDDTIASGQAFNDIPLCYFQLPSQSFNLGFDDSLIDEFYNEFNFFLDKYKEVHAFYNLDENDITELDFFIPIYDENFRQYFFISKLNDFIEGRSTEAELIRL